MLVTIDFDSDSDVSENELDPENDLDFLTDKMDNINLTPKDEKQWECTPGALVKVVAQMFDNERENITEVRMTATHWTYYTYWINYTAVVSKHNC